MSTQPSRIGIRLATAAVVIAGLWITPASQAAVNGNIVFSRFPSQSRQQIVSAHPDGSGLIALSHPKKGFFDIDASVSPDGSQVIYERDSDKDPARGGPQPQFRVVGSGGGSTKVLDLGCTDPCVFDTTPTWTPTPGRIAYTRIVGPFDAPNGSARSGVLMTSALDGSDQRRLSEPGIDGAYEDYYARYSPDGSYIVFLRIRNKPYGSAIFRMNADGTGSRRLTPWKIQADIADVSPATSGPTQDLIVFETYGHQAPKGRTQNLATVPATCVSLRDCRNRIHHLTHLRHGPGARFNPTWSPDGEQIAYTKFQGDEHHCCVGDIYTMRADGTHRRPVETSPKFAYRPDWGVAP